MNFVQTLYINKASNPFQNSFGWAAPEYHLMSWALSSLQLNKIYKQVELYANSDAAKLLSDVLELPYSKMHVTHDDLTLVNDHLWALPKIYTYALQEEPFLHLDGDVFIFDKFQNDLLEKELIAQNLEEATEYYTSTQKELLANFTYFPGCVKAEFDQPYPIKAVNAGILGGNNINFFKEYTNAAFSYINENIDSLSRINADRFNVFFEQHLFYCLAKEKKMKIDFFFADTIHDNKYQHLGEFHEVPCTKNYLHLLGHYKRDEFTCMQMAAKLRELYPDYYYKIITLCREKGISYSMNRFYAANFPSEEDFNDFNEKAKGSYNNGQFVSECDVTSGYFGDEIPGLSFLNEVVTNIKSAPEHEINGNHLKDDLNAFSKRIFEHLHTLSVTPEYLYGRDLESAKWYCKLFGIEQKIETMVIVRGKEITIIESEFDWAGILHKHKRIGVRYYEDLEITQGLYYNLVVPEVTESKVSLYDLDEMEKILLEELSVPMPIRLLLSRMEVYTEDEVIQNHYEIYKELILTLIKQLVVRKAIVPFETQALHH